MAKKKKEKPQLDSWMEPWDGEYIGNMFGWKTSFIGLAVILSLLALMIYRHAQIGDWRMMTDEEKQTILK